MAVGVTKNVDTHSENGVFTTSTDTTGTLPNTLHIGVMWHRTWDVNYMEQLWMCYADKKIYHRYKQDAVWSDWNTLATTDYAVSKAGDTINGDLEFYTSGKIAAWQDSNGYNNIALQANNGDKYTNIQVYVKDGEYGANLWSTEADGGKILIHTGNIGSQSVKSARIAATTAPGTASLKNIYAGTADLTAGSSTLATGTIYLVYE